MYGEMNKCMRPCQQIVSIDEYAHEVNRVEQFLRTNGASLADAAEKARDRASAEMDFEQAERWHDTSARIAQVRFAAGELAREVSQLHGVAIVPSSAADSVELWFLVGGRWQDARRVELSETAGAGSSMDRRIRELVGTLAPVTTAEPEHLSILMRWHGSTWRDGEWIPMDSLEKAPYRKIVNAIGRVAKGFSGAGSIGAQP
jgi:excinuclease UvrABC nuclease subunit